MRLLVDEKQQEVENWRVNFNSDLEQYSATAANNAELVELDDLRKKLARKEALIQDFNDQMDSDKEKIRSLHADFRTHMKLLKIRGEVIKELEQKETSLRLELLAAKDEVEKCKRINSKIEVRPLNYAFSTFFQLFTINVIFCNRTIALYRCAYLLMLFAKQLCTYVYFREQKGGIHVECKKKSLVCRV
jgi:hypothetical protein